MTDSLEDLSARSRRGRLDESERRRLKAMLGASVEGRLLHRAGSDLDDEDSVLPGDDAIAARIADRLVAHVAKARAPRGRRRFVLLAVAACLVTAVAAAGAARYRRALVARRTVAPVPIEVAAAAPAHRPEPVAPPSIAHDAPEAPTADEPFPSLPKPVAPAAASAPAASELFASAARARRDGNHAEAIRLYASLQHRYPAAAESRAADISLGMLHLARGAPGTALEHFQRYLRHSADGELVSEALWGEGESLRRLGRADDARKSFAALLSRFPDSAYAAAARARLDPTKSAP
jgi:TolA-binding protein